MKKFTLTTLLLLSMSILFIACSKEEDDDNNNNPVNNPCPLNDWLGDYTGTISVDGGAPTATDFELSEINTGGFQAIAFGYTAGDFTPTSCTVMKEFTSPFGKDINTLVLNGNEVTWTRQEFDTNDVLEETTVRVGTK